MKMRILALILCAVMVGAGPATEPSYEPPKLKADAPPIAKAVFDVSEAYKAAMRGESARTIEELKAKMEGIKRADIRPGKRMEKYNKDLKKWFYAFPSKADKDQAMKENERDMAWAEEKSRKGNNPKYIACEWFGPSAPIKVGAIGRTMYSIKPISIIDGKVLATLSTTDGGNTNVMLYGLDASRIADGQGYPIPEDLVLLVSGTENYTSVNGAARTVFKVVAYDLRPWLIVD